MTILIDRNAHIGAHDFGIPPFRLSGIYLAYWTGSNGRSHLKVGAVDVQSRNVQPILRTVRERVLVAVPNAGSRRFPLRPRVFVWVVFAANPVLRHELEQAVVDDFGNRMFDPRQKRRGEFCNPEAIVEVAAMVDKWRMALPEALSEALYSEDGGLTYTGPTVLLPYTGQTEGLWPEPTDAKLSIHECCVPEWKVTRSKRRWVVGRHRPIDGLMPRHDSRRVARLHKSLFESPAIPLVAGKAYEVRLPT